MASPSILQVVVFRLYVLIEVCDAFSHKCQSQRNFGDDNLVSLSTKEAGHVEDPTSGLLIITTLTAQFVMNNMCAEYDGQAVIGG